jgi:hypothetical protein
MELTSETTASAATPSDLQLWVYKDVPSLSQQQLNPYIDMVQRLSGEVAVTLENFVNGINCVTKIPKSTLEMRFKKCLESLTEGIHFTVGEKDEVILLNGRGMKQCLFVGRERAFIAFKDVYFSILKYHVQGRLPLKKRKRVDEPVADSLEFLREFHKKRGVVDVDKKFTENPLLNVRSISSVDATTFEHDKDNV